MAGLSWSAYETSVVFAALVVISPGPDFAVLTKTTLSGGRHAGTWTTLGITASNLVRGTAVAYGLGAVIV